MLEFTALRSLTGIYQPLAVKTEAFVFRGVPMTAIFLLMGKNFWNSFVVIHNTKFIDQKMNISSLFQLHLWHKGGLGTLAQ